MPDWSRIADPVERLHGFLSGFHATYYVYTGVECGLFEALVAPRTPDELAAHLELYPPYVRLFCEVGLRWGLLDIERGSGGEEPPAFQLEEAFVEPLADPTAVRYMGDLFRVFCAQMGTDYQSYPDTFESGAQRPVADRGPACTALVEGTTRGLQVVFVEKLLSELAALESRLADGGRILDVGCGAGHLACRLCARYPDASVVGIDLDGDAIDRARERAAREDVTDRATFRVQDATEVAGTFDGTVFFMSLHEIPPRDRRSLFDRLGDALTDDGVVAVFDEVYPDRYDRFDRQPYASAVETQWSELAWGTAVATKREQRDLLAAAGCRERTRTTVADRFVAYEATID